MSVMKKENVKKIKKWNRFSFPWLFLIIIKTSFITWFNEVLNCLNEIFKTRLLWDKQEKLKEVKFLYFTQIDKMTLSVNVMFYEHAQCIEKAFKRLWNRDRVIAQPWRALHSPREVKLSSQHPHQAPHNDL